MILLAYFAIGFALAVVTLAIDNWPTDKDQGYGFAVMVMWPLFLAIFAVYFVTMGGDWAVRRCARSLRRAFVKKGV